MIQEKTKYAWVVFFLFVGCSDSGVDLGQVSGVITLDGAPVSRATIIFHPTEGRSSIGCSDESGKYVLGYLKNERGAEVGDHVVTITTKLVADEQSGEGENRKELLPKEFHDKEKTELKATVQGGVNQIDFELKSSEF